MRNGLNIYIVFENTDVERIQNIVRPNDIIFGDILFKKKLDCRLIKPYIDKSEEKKIAESVQSFFDDISKGYFEHLKAFSNTFFEATVLPIATYMFSLKKIYDPYIKGSISFQVIFPSRIINKLNRTTFFLGEHETQRQFLYKRQLIFQPYLEKICKCENISIGYFSRSVFSNVFLTLSFRRWLMLFFRFCITAIKIIHNKLTRPQFLVKNELDFIAVTRLARKSEFLEPLLVKAGFHAELLVAESFISLSSNWSFSKKYLLKKKIVNPDLNLFFLTYSKAFLQQILTKKKFELLIQGIPINCKNAILEILVSYPDLLLYKNSLFKTLELSNHPKYKLLISTELKSPYAYADAFVAHKFGYQCFHVMDCDQASHPMPAPVFGDLFITNTKSAENSFKMDWGEDSMKVVFWGNLSLFNFLPKSRITNNYTWCYFTTARKEDDLCILEKINELSLKLGVNFIVKLHPRDNAYKYKKYRHLRIIADSDLSRSELFEEFSFGLTFSSAVIHDLMIFNKPFLIINDLNATNFNRSVHVDVFKNLVVNHNDIIKAVLNMNGFVDYFSEYQKKYIDDISITGDLNSFKFNLIKRSTNI